MTTEVPAELTGVVELVNDLKRQVIEKDAEIERLKAATVANTSDEADIEALLSDPQRRISDHEFRRIVPVPASAVKGLLEAEVITIQPYAGPYGGRTWLVADVLKLVRELGGVRLGFYRLQDVQRLFKWTSPSAVHKAAKRSNFPNPIKIGNTTVFVREAIDAVRREKWRSAA